MSPGRSSINFLKYHANLIRKDGTVDLDKLRALLRDAQYVHDNGSGETNITLLQRGGSTGGGVVRTGGGNPSSVPTGNTAPEDLPGMWVPTSSLTVSPGYAVYYSRGVLQLADNRYRPATHFVLRVERGRARIATAGMGPARIAADRGTSGTDFFYLGQNGLLTDLESDLRENRRLKPGVKYFQVLAAKAERDREDIVNASWNVTLTAMGD